MSISFSHRTLAGVTVVSLALLSLTAMPLLAQTSSERPSQHIGGSAHQDMTPEQMQQHHQSMLEQMRQMTNHMESMTPEMMAQMTPEQRQQHHQQMLAQMQQMITQMEHWGQMMQNGRSMKGSGTGTMDRLNHHPDSERPNPGRHQ